MPPAAPGTKERLRRQAELARDRQASGAKVCMLRTELCRFVVCHRGKDCDFAHSLRERRRRLDLTRTRICPAVRLGASCEDPACEYAHSRQELQQSRMLPPQPITLSEALILVSRVPASRLSQESREIAAAMQAGDVEVLSFLLKQAHGMRVYRPADLADALRRAASVPYTD